MNEPRTIQDSELAHIYREGGWPEPSRQIDQAILAASRREARRQRSFTRRWAPGFALAATVVLTFTLFLRVSEEKSDEQGALLLERPAPTPDVPSAAKPPKEEAVVKPAAVPKTPPAAGSKSPSEPAAARKATASMKPAPAATAAPAAAPVRAPRAPAPKPGSAESRPAPQSTAPARTAPVRAAPQPSKPAPTSGASTRQEPIAKSADSASLSPSTAPLKKDSADPRRSDQPEPQAERTRTEPAQPAVTERPPARSQASDALPAATRGSADGSRGAGSDSASSIVIRRSAPERAPQAWLDEIRQLRTSGRREEADRELAEFRKRHPDYVLPLDLL